MIVLCLFASGVTAQSISGEWKAMLSYHDASKSIKAFGKIYVLAGKGLFYYDPSDNSVYTYDKVDILSDTGISAIDLCVQDNSIVIGYENGNIDILYENNQVYNITDLLFSSESDKTIYDINVSGSKAIITTAFGIVVLDVINKQIDNSYFIENTPVSSVYHNGSLFCATNKGTYKGDTSKNLLDISNWNLLFKYNFKFLCSFDSELLGCASDNKLYIINTDTGSIQLFADNIQMVCMNNNRLIVWKNGYLYVYSSIDDYNKYVFDNCPEHVTVDGTYLWMCMGKDGLYGHKIQNNDIKTFVTSVIPNSPRRNYFNWMDFQQNKQRLLVAGGSLNYTGIDYEGTLMTYKDLIWNYFDDDISSSTGLKYINVTCIAEDPAEDNHFYVGSARHGMYEFRNGSFVKLHTWNNSGLTTIIPENPYNYVSVDGLKYDDSGNLWLFNNEVDTIIKIIDKEGNWHGLYYPEISGFPTFKHFLFDSNGQIWANSTRYYPGLFCINTNGTPYDNSDDTFKFSGNTFINQDGTSETINDIFFIEEDLEGIIWIGTDKGIFTIKDSPDFINNKNQIMYRIKIPRNDGSGQADYLLNGIYTTAICIDGANRKWIGTMNDGIFLIGSDNKETIEHFTTDNSPLLSNYIMSIEVNNLTGEVYIGTADGLNTYGGNATKAEEKLSDSAISVYPNPVMPEYDGYITITGLTYQSKVKVISTSGRLIYSGISDGGSFTWDGTGGDGKKVSSGIYHILVTDKNGNNGAVSKVTIIR